MHLPTHLLSAELQGRLLWLGSGLAGSHARSPRPLSQAATHQSATRFAPASRPWGRTPGTPSAVGVAGLPLGFAMEIEAIVEAAP